MSVLTLDKLWQDFREKQNLTRAAQPQQDALEYAFKCGVAAAIVSYMDLARGPEGIATLTINTMMNDFGMFIRSRMDLRYANRTNLK